MLIFYAPRFRNSLPHLLSACRLPAGRQGRRVSPTCTVYRYPARFKLLTRLVAVQECDATKDEQRCERRFKKTPSFISSLGSGNIKPMPSFLGMAKIRIARTSRDKSVIFARPNAGVVRHNS
jgi:hypothetical protein